MNIYSINNPYVPWSNGKCIANQFGDLIDTRTNTKLDLIEKDDGLYVELDWVDGKKLYNAAIVVIVAFRPNMLLPFCHYKNIIPLYINHNNKDITPRNLTYKLPTEGIEIKHSNFKGFYYIPEHTSYAISKDGRLYNMREDKVRSVKSIFKNPKERILCPIVDDFCVLRKRHLYKLLGITFIDHDESYNFLQINHINGNCQDNRIENLEWVTSKENSNHAFDTGLTSRNKWIDIKKYLTNEIINFRSIIKAAQYLKSTEGYIVKSIKIGLIKLTNSPTDWYYIKYKDDEWKEFSQEEVLDIPIKGISHVLHSIDIKALNIFTNNLFIFSSVKSAAKKLKVDSSGILYHLKIDSKVPYNGYIFRKMDDMRPFPKFDQEQLSNIKTIIESNPSGKINFSYIMKDLKTSEKRIFIKTRELSTFLDRSPKTINKRFKIHKQTHLFNDQYKITLIRPEGTME